MKVILKWKKMNVCKQAVKMEQPDRAKRRRNRWNGTEEKEEGVC